MSQEKVHINKVANSTAISVIRLSKDYWVLSRPKDVFRAIAGKQVRKFSALTNVSFEVKKGEVFGLLGPNGSGKSTMLKILTGVSEPTSGKVYVFGRLTAIIEVSTGFNPYLTGRENVRRRLMVYGFAPKEIRELEPSIIEFSELEDVIDEKTVTYSSGMATRLTFAVVTSALTDVVVLDELLAAGDEYFQGKCLKRINQLSASGSTVVIASHDTASLERLCDRCIWLERGKVRSLGESHKVVAEYLRDATQKDFEAILEHGHAKIESTEVTVLNDWMTFRLTILKYRPIKDLHVNFIVRDNRIGLLAYHFEKHLDDSLAESDHTKIVVSATIPFYKGLRRGLVAPGLYQGSSFEPGWKLLDGWGWANGRYVYFQGSSRVRHGGGYLGMRLNWKRCS